MASMAWLGWQTWPIRLSRRSTGSPLSEDCYRWVWDKLPKVYGQDIWLTPIAGGTDFAGAFIGGHRELPQVPGEMQCRLLGCAVEAWNEQGEAVIGEVGELVCSQPIPSMPLYFWGDTGHQRYLSSYFDMYPGVWRHGDWLKVGPNGGGDFRLQLSVSPGRYRLEGKIQYKGVKAGDEFGLYRSGTTEQPAQESLVATVRVVRSEVAWSSAVITRQYQSDIAVGLSARRVAKAP